MPNFLIDLTRCLRFYSRLPMPRLPGDDNPYAAPDLARITPVTPLAGAVIGSVGAIALVVTTKLGFDRFLAAAFAIAVLVAVTGALHEDGLADTADGLGGGRTREEKLEIMTDSRIGTFGAAALALALLLRVALVAELMRPGVYAGVAAVIAAAAVSRTAALWLAYRLPAARPVGAAHAVGRPDGAAFFIAAALAGLIAAIALVPALGPAPTVAGLVGAAGAAAFMSRLAARAIGGQTGDVAGALQQAAEIAFLTFTLAASASLL
jgi:adenosylcobinamide-GDP ribazoletransferase